MIRENIRFLALLLLVIVVLAAVSLLHGKLLVAGFEGDLIHTVDIAFRLVEGEKQHQDFMTPLGILTIYPVAVFIKAGFGAGVSILLAQALVCLLLLPLIAWVSISRLEGRVRVFFAISLIVVVTALVNGGDNPLTSVAIFYNRWAWAISALVIISLLIRPKIANTRADALVLGICGAWLVLLKVTYFAALLPFVLVALIHDRNWKLMLQALIVSLVCLAFATIAFGGIDFWQGYIRDLLETLVSPIRPAPGEDFGSLLGKPAYAPASLLMLATIVFFRKTDRMREGLLLLILFPCVVYITYQNWGNDPFWLLILGVAVLAILHNREGLEFSGIDAKAFQNGLAIIAFTIYAPASINQTFSVFRHTGQDPSEFAPLFSDARFADVQNRRSDNASPTAVVPIAIDPDLIQVSENIEEDQEEVELPVTVNGEILPDCDLSNGMVGMYRQIVHDLEKEESAEGKHVLVADLLDPMWLFGNYKRNNPGAPWFYGDTGGYQTAEMLLVPFCPVSVAARKHKLLAFEKRSATLKEVMRSKMFILFQLEY